MQQSAEAAIATLISVATEQPTTLAQETSSGPTRSLNAVTMLSRSEGFKVPKPYSLSKTRVSLAAPRFDRMIRARLTSSVGSDGRRVHQSNSNQVDHTDCTTELAERSASLHAIVDEAFSTL